jgi:phage-related protein
VRPGAAGPARPLFWVGSSKKDLLEFPKEVVRALGYVLGVVQHGGTPETAKPWKGAGSGVLELVEDWRGDTFRVVYVVRFREAIYVLHCFQKKSPSGIRTARSEVERIERRLRRAGEEHEARYGR